MDMSIQKHLQRREIVKALSRHFTRDATYTYDRMTIDSTGAFLIGQLERLDQQLHEPLVDVTWSRDIDIRTDVSPADEISSFTNSTFASAGGATSNGLNWISNEGNAVAGPTVDIGKTGQPLRLWGAEVKYTVPELVKAQALGAPIDEQKVTAMNMKRNMDIDQVVYYGDPAMSFTGLFNASAVTNVSNVPNGASSSPLWTSKTPAEILKDINEILTSAWQASAWAVLPNRIMLPPAQYGYIASQLVSTAGTQSILKYVMENNIVAQRGEKIDILPAKWLIGLGSGGTQGVLSTVDRMVAYRKELNRVRFPMTELQRTPLEYRSLFQITTYWCRLGQIEFPYPTTLAYRDGL